MFNLSLETLAGNYSGILRPPGRLVHRGKDYVRGERNPRFMPYGMTTTDHTGVRTTVGLGLDGTHFVLERQLGDRVDRFEQARL